MAKMTDECIRMLKALADETRWRIVRELLAKPSTVNGLVDRLNVPQYNVSKHLKILRDAGIIEGIKHGREMECHVAKSFRRRLKDNENCLDLGCCTFRFDEPSPTG